MPETSELSPDQTVALEIVAQFRAQELLDARQLDNLAERLAAGTLTAEDWTLYAELTEETARKSTHSNAD